MAVNVELGFITELLVSKDYATASDQALTAKYFQGKYKTMFKFIMKHISSYGNVPSLLVFDKEFPNNDLLINDDGKVYSGESMQYWCDEVRRKTKHNMIVEGIAEVVNHIGDLNTEEAYALIQKTVLKVENEVVLSESKSINKDVDARYRAYKELQNSGGLTGIPTYIKHWDDLTGGLHDGELTTIMGYTGRGKSWYLITTGVEQAKAGYKVLLFTTEMSTKMVMRRTDAVWAKLNYSDFKKGQLKPDQEKRYLKHLEDMRERSDEDGILIIEQALGGVSQISAKIDQYDPDVILVDGAYLLEDEEGDEDNWMGMTRVWRALHRLALRKKKPIVVTTQSKDDEGASLKSMSFAKAIANECDVVAVLEQDEQMRNDNEAMLVPLKLREGDSLAPIMLNWDFNTMEYGSIYKERVKEDIKVDNIKGVLEIA